MMNLIRSITSLQGRNNSNKPVAILHIGVEKTGTTTIQEFLHLNRELLKEQGIWFPGFFGLRNHRHLAIYCSDSRRSNLFTRLHDLDCPEKRKRWKDDFRHSFAQEMEKTSRCQQVVLSSEHFTSLLKEPEEIELLKNFLAPFFAVFVIIIYIRRQDLVAGSMISNAARAGFGTKLPQGDEIATKHYYNYYRLLNKWAEIFGRENIRLRIFEKEQLIDQDLLQDFMQQTGIQKDKKFRIPGRMNTSLSATAIESAWLFNKKFSVKDVNTNLQLLRKLRLELIREVNEKYPGPGKMLLKKDASAMLKLYEDRNRQLARDWLRKDQLFSADLSMYPETEHLADPALVQKLVEEFIKRKGLIPVYE